MCSRMHISSLALGQLHDGGDAEEVLLGRRLLGQRRGSFQRRKQAKLSLVEAQLQEYPIVFRLRCKGGLSRVYHVGPLSKDRESFSNEALQDLRPCEKCQTMSYLRKGFCINMHCADYFMLKKPSTRQRGPNRGKKTQISDVVRFRVC